jgi:predicted MPP superfamily phosphohydrolase
VEPPPFTVTPIRRGPAVQVRDVRGFAVTGVEFRKPGLPPSLDGLRVLHLTDLHLTRRWMAAYDELFARLRDRPPDLILVTGDFVDPKFDHLPVLPTLDRFLAGLTSRLGTFGILGNHDGDLLAPKLGSMKVNLINGARALLRSGDPAHPATIDLIGLPGVGREDVTPALLAGLAPAGDAAGADLRIVMTHYPDTIAKAAQLRPDLVLAGHTHGGQVCLPTLRPDHVGRPLMTHDGLPRSMSSGVFATHGTTLVIPRGLGFSKWPIRLFCPAEVVEITIRSPSR